jgi:hypothetical protein
VSAFSASRQRLSDWPLWIVAIAFALAISITAIGTGLVGVIFALGGGKVSSKSPGLNIASTVVLDSAMVGAALLAARMIDGRVRLQGFGFRPLSVSRKRAALLAIATWMAFLIFTLGWTKLVGDPGKQSIVKSFGAHDSNVLWALTLVMVALLAPLCEELMFRGLVFAALWRNMPLALAAAITGALFGALHLGGSPVLLTLPLAVLGGLLCLLRAATGSLLPCLAVHALNNSVAYSVSEKVGAGFTLLIAAGSVSSVLIIGTALTRRAYTQENDGNEPRPSDLAFEAGDARGDGFDPGSDTHSS